LERLRDVAREDVRNAIRRLLTTDGWFTDLTALERNAQAFKLLAPAASITAVTSLEHLLSQCSIDDLRTGLAREARRAIVDTLDCLALRTETFRGAAACLLLLAEAENEAWDNNATGVFLGLFHWRHPEIPASFDIRADVLAEAAQSDHDERRRIIALACGQALSERRAVRLHTPEGCDLPQDRFGATWGDAHRYASRILDILGTLQKDRTVSVVEAAVRSLLLSVASLVDLSVSLEGANALATKTFGLLAELGNEAGTAQLKADVRSALERSEHRLRTRWLKTPELETRAGPVLQALEKVRLESLSLDSLQDRLWRWVGPGSWRDVHQVGNRAAAEAGLEKLATDLVEAPENLGAHMDWLTGDEAKGAIQLLRRIGQHVGDGETLDTLLSKTEGPYWPSSFSAYLYGWYQCDRSRAEATLDGLIDSRPELGSGLIAAICELPTTTSTVERLSRLLRTGTMARAAFSHHLALRLRWSELAAEEVRQLLEALDDGTPEVRQSLLVAFVDQHERGRGAGLTAELRQLAWSYLRSTIGARGPAHFHYWDALAANLAEGEPDQLIATLDEVFAADEVKRSEHLSLQYELPQVWEVLKDRHRAALFDIALRHAMAPHSSPWLDGTLAELIEPERDRQIVLHLAQEYGAEAARAFSLALDADKTGFWSLAREIVRRWGDDDVVTERLLGGVTSGTWSGSALDVIEARIEEATQMRTDNHPSVRAWAEQVISELEHWRRRTQREDQEGWLWDSRVRRVEMEQLLRSGNTPERLWAIGRLLEDAPEHRVRELISPEDILEALPRLPQLDELTRNKWELYARHHLGRHH
ncbi:MAG: hypothetical protein ACRD1T_01040, partial [Acidimicrobiia bacterium]